MKPGPSILYHLQILIIIILSVLACYQLGQRFNWQIDFTEENRYTFHPAVEDLITALQDPVSIEVYLDGDLPSNFIRLQNAIRATLERFYRAGNENIQFKFTDPAIAESSTARNQFYRELISKGIQPSNVAYTRNGQRTEKLVFPGAVINYRGKELGVTLLKGNRTRSIEEMLNQSIEGLEYEIAGAIRQLTQETRKRIGFITGHHDLDSAELAGFTNAVLTRYDLFQIDLARRSGPLRGYDAIVIGKPTKPFSEKEKYHLDQYVMGGGNLLIFMDALSVNMQEAEGEGTVALPYELNLEDLLFKYGVRINRDYVADVNCGNTPVVTGSVGNQPRIELLPWPYWPIISNYSDHPLVKNMDATWLRGTSTIDTVKAAGIRKTALFFTSDYTKVFGPPVRISYNDLNQKLDPETFLSGRKCLAYLLEGSFSSLYANRFKPDGIDETGFRKTGVPGKILVVSDGDFIRNDFSLDNDNPLPMGLDPYSQTTYANEDFVRSALEYMVDDPGLMSARNKEIRIRPLDKVKISRSADYWRWLNVALPIMFIVIFGVIKGITRKYKYGKS